MPEFIPRANTPDQLARYVLEIQRQTPTTGQQVAGGVSQVARAMMDKIKAKKELEGQMQITEARQRPQQQETWSSLLARHKDQFALKEEPELQKALSGIGATSLEQLPPTVENLRLVGEPVKTSIIGPTGQVVREVAGKTKMLPGYFDTPQGMETFLTLYKSLGKEEKSMIAAGEIPAGLVGFFESKNIPVEYRTTFIQKIKDWISGEQKHGTYFAPQGVIPKEESGSLGVMGKGKSKASQAPSAPAKAPEQPGQGSQETNDPDQW